MRSMTAFGTCRVETISGPLTWELRSVNHRYLDIQVRLPERFRHLEMSVRQRAKGAAARGKLDITLRSEAATDGVMPLQIDDTRLDALGDALAHVRSRVPDLSIDALAVLRWPGVLLADNATGDAAEQQTVLSALDTTLDDWCAMRLREGTAIAGLIDDRAMIIGRTVSLLRTLRPAVVEAQRLRLQHALSGLSHTPDLQRLEQEMVYAAQRLDIDEELDRIDHHVAELGRVTNLDEPVGRRLDFILQELNREANTLGSKASDTAALDASVELKVVIEQMREQVQNVE